MVDIQPFDGGLGAAVTGVDLSEPVPEDITAALNAAFIDHILLVFRGQTLDNAALKSSANWLGSPSHIHMPTERRVGGDFNIHLISNIRDEEGREIGSFGDGDMWFHHDNCFTPAPDRATWLYAVELPSEGGDTLFADCYRAWESLPDDLKNRIAGKNVLQVYDYTVQETPDLSDLTDVPNCWQPAVLVHPETRRPALYVNRLMSAAIEGMEADEAKALLEEVFPYVERTDYTHHWEIGDYIIWDNRCSAHARTAFPADQRRLLKRGKVAGCPVEAFTAAA